MCPGLQWMLAEAAEHGGKQGWDPESFPKPALALQALWAIGSALGLRTNVKPVGSVSLVLILLVYLCGWPKCLVLFKQQLRAWIPQPDYPGWILHWLYKLQDASLSLSQKRAARFKKWEQWRLWPCRVALGRLGGVGLTVFFFPLLGWPSSLQRFCWLKTYLSTSFPPTSLHPLWWVTFTFTVLNHALRDLVLV